MRGEKLLLWGAGVAGGGDFCSPSYIVKKGIGAKS